MFGFESGVSINWFDTSHKAMSRQTPREQTQTHTDTHTQTYSHKQNRSRTHVTSPLICDAGHCLETRQQDNSIKHALCTRNFTCCLQFLSTHTHKSTHTHSHTPFASLSVPLWHVVSLWIAGGISMHAALEWQIKNK